MCPSGRLIAWVDAGDKASLGIVKTLAVVEVELLANPSLGLFVCSVAGFAAQDQPVVGYRPSPLVF